MTPKPAVTREFVINPYLAVRLEGPETVIYVGGRRFRQCKALVFDLPGRVVHDPVGPTSIDEVAALYRQYPLASSSTKIPSEVEFWGHCSNLQAWADNDYDTRLLHSNLAFPLLTALADAGELHARVVLGREVVARFTAGYMPVVKYLVEGEYYRFLTAADLDALPRDVLMELYGTGAYDLNPGAFTRLAFLPPIVTLGGKRYAIRDGKIDASNLNVTNAELKKLPKYDDQVKILVLSHNRLRAVPESLGNLTSLRSLVLSHNRLRAVPESLGNLHSLLNLSLDNNQLRFLPESLGNLTSLTNLILRGNQLRVLPESLGNLASLERLDLSRNELETIPDAFGKLTSLRLVGLCDNHLQTLPDALHNLPALQFLDVDRNPLQKKGIPIKNKIRE